MKELYGNDINYSDLEAQFQTIAPIGKGKVPLREIIQYLASLSEPTRSIYLETVLLVESILVMPASNATSERSFSALRRIKSYLRTTMMQERLNK